MALPTITQPAAQQNHRVTSIQGTLRCDRRTKDLVKRLRPGDIAFIHHEDLDAIAARALVDARVSAVVNAARSITGRYPNGGPSVLVEAGIPLIDTVGEEAFVRALAAEGNPVLISADCVIFADGSEIEGSRLTAADIERDLVAARANLGSELDAFARNTLTYLNEEKGLLLDPVLLPDVATSMKGRHVMVVVRGEGYKDDLGAVREYLEEVRPVLIGVDGGADALIEAGLRPHIIIGDMDSVSDAALKSGAELIVHGYANGDRTAPGLQRIDELGLKAKVFHSAGTSEDVAILLADAEGASLITAVGTHFSLIEFLDKGRGGMASTFLVRLRTGSKLVDAKGVGRLWEARRKSRKVPALELLLLFAAALFPIAVIGFYSPWLRTVINAVRLSLRARFGLH